MNNLSPSFKVAGIVLILGLVFFGLVAIVLVTFVIVRGTTSSPTQASLVLPTTIPQITVIPVPATAMATAFPPTQTDTPPVVEPSPSDTAEPPTGQTIQPADDFVIMYFKMINDRNYTETWARLSDKYKAAYNPDGFGPYVKFWNSVQQVAVVSPQVIAQKVKSAKVSVRLNLTYTNGKKGSQVVTFDLVPDAQGTSWLIDNSY